MAEDPAIVGIDVGGTFTDVVLLQGGRIRTAKVLSTGSPEVGVLAALAQVGIPAADPVPITRFCHGMTVATNALLERKGVPTGLLTTAGFRDLLWLARQHRPHLYDLTQVRPDPVVTVVEEVQERCGPTGVINPLTEDEISRVVTVVATWVNQGIQAVAVGLLFGFLYPDHEQRLGVALRRRFPDLHLSLSSQVAPEMREYERLSTTAIDAYLTPTVGRYLQKLGHACTQARIPLPLIMQSSGGVVPIHNASGSRVLLSGPAGGVWGAAAVGSRSGYAHLLAFDMGGTSTDVALIRSGQPQLTPQAEVCGFPILQPQIDIQTVSAGGGSLAQALPGGGLRVGPESAGSQPGPAAYGRGGSLPTVTDANVWLGYLPDGAKLGDSVQLNRGLAEQALQLLADKLGLTLAATAHGIRTLAHGQMARALRLVSIERGQDPSTLALMAYGGAGPMHACGLAQELGIRTILIPAACGVLSALGMAVAPVRRDYRQPLPSLGIPSDWARRMDPLYQQAQQDLNQSPDLTLAWTLDLRYRGQSFELGIPVQWEEDPDSITIRFHQTHQQCYGWQDPAQPIEVVTIRLEATLPPPPLTSLDILTEPGDPRVEMRSVWDRDCWRQWPVYHRSRLRAGLDVDGPALVLFKEATVVVDPGWHGHLDPEGTLILVHRPL